MIAIKYAPARQLNIRPVRVTKVRWNCSRVCNVVVG